MSSPSAAKLVWKNIQEFHGELKAYDQSRRKAGETAVRVELYRLRTLLKRELRGGGAGGAKFAPLRAISKHPPNSRRNALSALAVAVRYWYERIGDKTKFSLGFKGGDVWSQGQDRSNRSNLIRGNQLSKSWRSIAETLQKGTTTSIPPGNWLRRVKIRRGGRFEESGQYPRLRKFFFLRKTTTEFKTPARPIVAPFWRVHMHEAELNIASNFQRKMRGERI